MKIEIAPHARMSERGSSLLRLIQNNDMPLLDLLVREAVQNSLDAAIPNNEGSVNIDFSVNSFDSSLLSAELEGISDNLNRRFPNEQYKLLEIRDKYTQGLTGPLHYHYVQDHNFGNLLKLVYEISMPQHKEGAGGSWGLGKTVYFRIGIGLVFYYSRIKDEHGSYSSRLAACLVEDERKSDALIHSTDGKPQRGIAWWGQEADDQSTMPLTNDNEIVELLSLLNIKPFEDDETGTSIIIPYINEKALLEGIVPNNDSEETLSIQPPWWTSSIEQYLSVALQRWYAPRLFNQKYKYGNWLNASVGGKPLDKEKMLPLFRTAQVLYNKASLSQTEQLSINNAEIFVEKITLRNMFNEEGNSGHIAFVKLTREQLLMDNPHNNVSPLIQANKFEADTDANTPIIMYVRKPGMIVDYETAGPWTDGIPKTASNEFIIGMFVPNSNNTLKKTDDRMTLEEYLRKSEKADHTSWSDWSIGAYNPSIVSKTQKQATKNMINKYAKTERPVYAQKHTGLSRKLAQLLLPPENFGTRASVPDIGKPGSGNGSSKGTNHKLSIASAPRYIDGNITIDFELEFGRQTAETDLQLQVMSEAGGIEAEKWEDEDVIGTEFPLQIIEVNLTKVQLGKRASSYQLSAVIKEDSESIVVNNVSVKVLRSSRFNLFYGVKIIVPEKSNYKILGSVQFRSNDEKVQGGLSAVPVKANESKGEAQ
jgi:hypothetical protein